MSPRDIARRADPHHDFLTRAPSVMWPESEQSKRLLKAAQAGDREAVNELLERHREALRRLVELRLDRRIQHRVDASDVIQEVLVEASRRLPDYLQRPPMAFHLWIRQIARDRIIDAHRRHRAAARRSVDREQALAYAAPDRSTLQLVRELCDPELTPAAAATQHELALKIEQALERLSDSDREMILMRHYEQLTNQEVAQCLELNEAAASMRYLRAVRRLRELLTEPG